MEEAALVIASYRREDIDGCFANRCERSDEAFEIIIGAPASASVDTGIEAYPQEDQERRVN